MVALIRAASLTNFADVARQLGIDATPALRSAGIDPRALGEPEMRIPAAAVGGLLENAASQSGCETFGLRMGEVRRLSDFGALSLLIAHQPTLRAALDVVITYRRMLNEHLVIAVEESDDIVIVREELIVDGPPTGRQASELMIAVLFRMFRALLGPRWRPLSVSFTHPPPSDLSAHRRLFGCEVDFNAEFSGVVLPAADLDRPNPSADPALAQYAEQFVESFPKARPDSALHQVQKAAYHLLPIGRASIGLVAQTLGINERTLQRRLAAEGVHFSDVICEVRRSLALRYLANPTLSVTQVARMLGYGQISSFTRWFIGEFGQAPGQWRRQGQGE